MAEERKKGRRKERLDMEGERKGALEPRKGKGDQEGLSYEWVTKEGKNTSQKLNSGDRGRHDWAIKLVFF